MANISFKATQGVYLTYKHYPYKAPQVLGEFIDNAIQSYENNKNIFATLGQKLRVDISFKWEKGEDNVVRATSITIEDNAAGMSDQEFGEAFDLANGDVTRSGMNEFGVGMKAAAAWLGNHWHIETTSITDNITRVLDVDLKDICSNNIEFLASQEFPGLDAGHGTILKISDLWRENSIAKSNIDEIIKSVASIYRYYLRSNEIEIYIDDTLLHFEEYQVLSSPSYKDPKGEDITWRCNVWATDKQGHKISGFIALLKDMADDKRGVVFMRNHRVVMGFDPKDRTIGNEFNGRIGSPKYHRVFGELEIEGFTVAFGKNQVNDQDALNALCSIAAGKLIVGGVNLLTQGDKYRKNKKTTLSSAPVPKQPNVPNDTPKQPLAPSSIPHPKQPLAPSSIPNPKQPLEPAPSIPQEPETTYLPKPQTSETSSDTLSDSEEDFTMSSSAFHIGDKTYQIRVEQGSGCDELFWNDLSQKHNNTLICKVRLDHPFFTEYGKPSKQMLAMIKALSIAKFTATITSEGSASAMMNKFNEIIKSQAAES